MTRMTSIYEFAPYNNLHNSYELQSAKFLKLDKVSFTLRQFNYEWLTTSLAAFTKTFLALHSFFRDAFLNKDFCSIFVSNYVVISWEAYSLWELLIFTELGIFISLPTMPRLWIIFNARCIQFMPSHPPSR